MLYFKPFYPEASLVPFTAPVIPSTHQDGNQAVVMELFCHDKRIYRGTCRVKCRADQSYSDAIRIASCEAMNILNTLIQYINQTVRDMCEEGTPNLVINVADWEEGIECS